MKYTPHTELDSQRRWIDEHGGDLAGYIERYGEPGLTKKWYGAGGAAIFWADLARLHDLERQCTKRPRRAPRFGPQ